VPADAAQLFDDLVAALATFGPEVGVRPRPGGAGEVVIYDPEDPPPLRPGDVVLAVGARAILPPIIDAAAAAAAMAVVAKGSIAELEEAAAEARGRGVGFLAVPSGALWAEVLSLVRSALASSVYEGAGERLSQSDSARLSELADSIAIRVDGPVAIEDVNARILGYSGDQSRADSGRVQAILERRTPAETLQRLRRDGVLRKLATTAGPVLVPGDGKGSMPRLGMPIRIGNELVGVVWAIVGDRPDQSSREALDEAAHLAASQLLHERIARHAERGTPAHLLRRLLFDGDAPAEISWRLGFSNSHFRVLAMRVACGEPHQYHDQYALLLGSNYLRLHLRSSPMVAGSGEVDGVLYAVLTVNGGRHQSYEQTTRFVERVLSHVGHELPTNTILGVGGHARSIGELVASREQADSVLRVLERSGARCAWIDDVAAQVRLLKYSEESAEDGSDPSAALRRLFEHDSRHRTSYFETLGAFFDAFGDARRAGVALHVHPATVRYRIRRIIEICGVDLDDPEERLALMLDLHAVRASQLALTTSG
jgi:hypothetical protein